tara:strand:+ start:512 stop:775 length:264 start_codon:yes stop_codon:yes gene_type:complete
MYRTGVFALEARIKGVVVLIVARFVIFMVDGKISPLNTVTAHSDRTGVCAGILIIVVPIIASFIALLTWLQILSKTTVTTVGELAVC